MPVHTLFVKSLPDSATNEHLEEICSEVGPVKQCFVVNEKGTQKCRGFGYVTYAMEEDAQRALKETLQYDGQRISLSMAKKKIVDNKKGASKEPPAAPSGKEPKSDGSGKEQKSSGLRKNQLKARLIIRNLSFKCSENELKQSFGEHGKVLEVKIPLKPDGKMRGFAFVQFKSVSEAGKALNAMNLKEIKGRTVAVDWAVPKDKYVATQPPSKAAPAKSQEVNANPASSESDSEEYEEEEETPPKKKVSSKQAVKKVEESPKPAKKKAKESAKPAVEESPKPAVKKSQKTAVEELPSDDDEDQDSEEEEEDDDEDDDRNLDSEDDDDDDDGDDDDDDDDYDDDDDDDESGQKKPPRKALPSDVNQGRTIFIRNLSFDTEEEGLEEILLKFGELNYVKIVVHPDTEHSKGVAFAQFKRKEAADKCIAAAEDEAENGGIRADGRKLIVVAAVSKDDAVKLKTTKVKVETGTRNLYLAREGMIREGTKAAEGVPATDMAKRMRFEELKRTKLKDLQVFVSKTRLCVHNLPKSVDNKKLRALCLSAAKASMGARITECRVMYDRKPQKGQVLGLSLGYGFVEFQAHEHALSALRHLNNNPDIFGAHKRPIVEFSLEDGRKLKMKELRQQKNKEYSRNGPLSGANAQVVGAGAGLGPGSKKTGPKTQPSSPWQAGKNKAAGPQKWSQGKHHSGFQTNPVVEHVEFEDGKKRRKVLPLPSHRGPKNRVRDKGKNLTPAPVKAKNHPSRSEQQKTINRRPSMEKPTQPRPKSGKMPKRRSKDDDRFESLVAQYKRKLLGTTNKPTIIKKSKWFDS